MLENPKDFLKITVNQDTVIFTLDGYLDSCRYRVRIEIAAERLHKQTKQTMTLFLASVLNELERKRQGLFGTLGGII